MKIRRINGRKQVSLRTAITLVITALIAQYFLLEGPVTASAQKYFPSYFLTTASFNFNRLQYAINDYVLTIEVPEETQMQVSPDKGEEMQFSMYFTNSRLAFRGYIQVWKMKDLESFLTNSKTLSPFDFISYNMSTIQKNASEGFKTEWSADFGEKYLSGKEFWWTLHSPEEIVRVSFFTDTAEFPKGLDPVIQHILNSLQIDAKKII